MEGEWPYIKGLEEIKQIEGKILALQKVLLFAEGSRIRERCGTVTRHKSW